MRSLHVGATGMLAQQMNVDTISNNIANMRTTGFKKQRAEFHDLLYQNVIRPGSNSSDVGTIMPSGIQMGLGVRTASVYRVHTQGSFVITDNNFDTAISGEGWFQITQPNGDTAYTRDGSFRLDDQGQLVTSQGFQVQPGITVPDDAVSVEINRSGEVIANLDGQVAGVNLGQIQLSIFPNQAGLEAIGDNLMLETVASGAPITGVPGDDGYGEVYQGALEESNVNVVSEMTDLIAAQRAYEMNSQVISTSDEMMGTVSQLR